MHAARLSQTGLPDIVHSYIGFPNKERLYFTRLEYRFEHTNNTITEKTSGRL